MAIKGRGGKSGRTMPPLPKFKTFNRLDWYEHIAPHRYITHLLRELGRLDLDIHDIEHQSRPPNGQTVLSDLLEWLDERPAENFATLFDWTALDFDQMAIRLKRNVKSKPRIEISAHITKMNNLSVRWHPAGWRNSHPNWGMSDRDHNNLITQRTWKIPPDFSRFQGDQQPGFDSRPTNELMFIRGVGNLRPEPRDSYGPYATFNRDVVDGILIGAVRAAYESMIDQLQHSFEVEALDAFDFKISEELSSDDGWADSSVRHVIGWEIESTAELRARRAQTAAIKREEKARAEISNIAATYGCTLDEFTAALRESARPKAGKADPGDEQVNRATAKVLRTSGANIDAGNVRRLRAILQDFMPERLPEGIRRESVVESEAIALTEANVVVFPSRSRDQD